MTISKNPCHTFYFWLPIVLLSLTLSCSKDIRQSNTESWAFSSFEKVDSLNPILFPEKNMEFFCPINAKAISWESRNVLNPAAVVKDGIVYLFYRAQDSTGTSRIGIATSENGLEFNKSPEPVLYPDNDFMKRYEWNFRKFESDSLDLDCVSCYFDGVEDPRIVMDDQGTYFMTYTSYDGKTARLCVASSKDLYNWQKHGLAFKNDKYQNLWSKAGAIVSEVRNGQAVAGMIDGKYWMYFGDTDIFIANSLDLVNWNICENEESGKMISVMNPRMGYFDSRLVEPGPFAMIKEEGILLIYNGSNAANFNDPELPKFTYSAGQAIFDKENPFKLLDRSESYFITPDKDYEKVGEVNDVCFVEGLVKLDSRWLLYYGTADSKIAVAVNGEETMQ